MWKRKLKKNDDGPDWVEEEEEEKKGGGGCKGQKSLERLWEKEKEKRF